jgi:hypothetical protein
MRRLTALIALICLASAAVGESLRGPFVGMLSVTPTETAETTGIGLESVVLIGIDGDARFLDAIDIEVAAPSSLSEQPGALVLTILGPVNVEERSGVADAVGEELVFRPLIRGGKSFYQVLLRTDASPDASPAVTRVSGVVPPASFPLAVSVVPRMKGLAQELQNAEFTIAARPVTRNIGAVQIRYVLEDGSVFDADSSRVPDFELSIDGEAVEPRNEYLLEPGLHTLQLRSERFRDQEITFGVDRGRSASVDLPLELALATVNYTAPRGSTVYVNGRVLDASTGDFTVPPGEHTIVAVVGDYTVTRRFRVEEQRSYSISVILDIAIEEIK